MTRLSSSTEVGQGKIETDLDFDENLGKKREGGKIHWRETWSWVPCAKNQSGWGSWEGATQSSCKPGSQWVVLAAHYLWHQTLQVLPTTTRVVNLIDILRVNPECIWSAHVRQNPEILSSFGRQGVRLTSTIDIGVRVIWESRGRCSHAEYYPFQRSRSFESGMIRLLLVSFNGKCTFYMMRHGFWPYSWQVMCQ